MKTRIKIKFANTNEASKFINMCSKYISDIDIYDGHIAIDAKSIISVFTVELGKEITVEIVSQDIDEIERFIKDVAEYEV